MMELLFFCLIGSLMGIFAGLVPGLHVNNIVPLVIGLSVFVGDPHSLAVMIVSMSVSQVFASFIPSIFIGAPEADTSLSSLPGHRMLQEGRGFEAMRLTVLGGVCSLAVSFLLIYLLSPYFRSFYDLSRPYIGFALLGILAFMVLSERRSKRMIAAACIILASGLLGVISLGSPLSNQQSILFPLLTGLFGMSVLVSSVASKSGMPVQDSDGRLSSRRSDLVKSIALGSIAGLVVGFLPAVGVSQAATIFQQIGGLNDPRTFLASLSGINVANEAFSLNSVYLIDNPRSGASVAVERLLGEISQSDLMLFSAAIAISAGIGSSFSLLASRIVPRMMSRVNYRLLSVAVVVMLVSMVGLMTGPFGLLVAAASVSVGVLCIKSGARNGNCMGVLMVPSVLFFFGASPGVLAALGL